MRKDNRKLITISLLSIPLSAGIALVPVLSDLAAVFPDQNGWMQLLITIPSLFMMGSSLLTDWLAKKTSIQFVAQISVLTIAFAGMSPYWIDGFAYLLLTRGLMGLGLGALNTAVASLPALYFEAGKRREHAVGIQSAFICVGGVLFTLVSGTVAKYDWSYVFLVQAINVVPLLAAILFMPAIESKTGTEPKRQMVFVKSAMPVVGISFISVALTCTYPLNLSLFVERQGLGSSQFVGLLTGINSAIGFLIGLVFGAVYGRTKEQTLPLGLGLAAVGLWAIAPSAHQAVLLAGSVCFGIGTSLISPSLYAMLYQRVKPEEVISSVAMLGIACNVSQFISPFVINPMAKIIDGHGAERARLIVASILIFLLAIRTALARRRGGRSQTEV